MLPAAQDGNILPSRCLQAIVRNHRKYFAGFVAPMGEERLPQCAPTVEASVAESRRDPDTTLRSHERAAQTSLTVTSYDGFTTPWSSGLKRKCDDHTLSYAETIAKSASESIQPKVRKRRKPFAGFVVRMGVERLPQKNIFGELDGNKAHSGGQEKRPVGW